ncbi:leucyl aminopeptidase [Streptomyces bohaiensis]|uniref:Probable cytosol aminopeptidase n=1 Tax=Streptomyces bohaiensis TaxID=1431344 RepID=A0ABX1CEE9_9ACTN|nr:leucyl aminopeptidase [Streptomyces bohaiensis]NJQ16180.1 leucyl aminopeptidase [Streptomyces bohaiensis]
MTVLTLSDSSAAKVRADAVVVGIAKGEDGPLLTSGQEVSALDAAFGGKLAATLGTLGAKGAADEVTKVPAPEKFGSPLVVAVGLGSLPEGGEGFEAETLRRAAGSAARALGSLEHAVFALPLADAAALAAVAEGALLGAYSFSDFRGTDGDAKGRKSRKGKDAKGSGADHLAEVTVVGLPGKAKAHRDVAERARVLAEETARTRDLVNTPPNALTPEVFAAEAQAAAKEHGLKIEVLDEQALAKGGYGGILGVGQGSQSPPRLVRIAYTHAKGAPTLALVGKGITYDSGGISLKPAGHNETMKCDMAGAGAVLSAVVAAARLGLKANVTGWLALAENMPSGSATRPGDVLTMYSGRTVEVLNTDAEGRLVMADAITRACEEEPDALVDVATLTGAMMVALGKRIFGVMANDDAFRELVHTSAAETGEQSWPMPLPDEMIDSMKSSVADIANVGDRMGGGLAAGLFLREFVSEGTTWAHLDIAGPAFHEGAPFGYTPKGGTGTAVRALVRLAERTADGALSA